MAGIVLTSSVFPLAWGGFPHPLVLGSFAAYEVPVVGEAVLRTRRVAVDPEPFVRLGLRMLTVDPSTIPEDVIALHAELLAEVRADPEAPAAFLEAARSINAYVRSRSLGARAMGNVRCPVLVIHGRQATGSSRSGTPWPRCAGTRRGAAGSFRASATCRRWRRPARWLTEVADWYAAELR